MKMIPLRIRTGLKKTEEGWVVIVNMSGREYESRPFETEAEAELAAYKTAHELRKSFRKNDDANQSARA